MAQYHLISYGPIGQLELFQILTKINTFLCTTIAGKLKWQKLAHKQVSYCSQNELHNSQLKSGSKKELRRNVNSILQRCCFISNGVVLPLQSNSIIRQVTSARSDNHTLTAINPLDSRPRTTIAQDKYIHTISCKCDMVLVYLSQCQLVYHSTCCDCCFFSISFHWKVVCVPRGNEMSRNQLVAILLNL